AAPFPSSVSDLNAGALAVPLRFPRDPLLLQLRVPEMRPFRRHAARRERHRHALDDRLARRIVAREEIARVARIAPVRQRPGIGLEEPQLVPVRGRAEGLVLRAHDPIDLAAFRIDAEELAVMPVRQPELIVVEREAGARAVRAAVARRLALLAERPE